MGPFSRLDRVYGELRMAEAVWQELNGVGYAWPGRDAVAHTDWIMLQSVTNGPRVMALQEHREAAQRKPSPYCAERRSFPGSCPIEDRLAAERAVGDAN
jgi:hypothetical protein